MPIIYQNQSIRIYFSTGLDDAGASSVVLKYRDPEGNEGTFSETPIPVPGEEDQGNYYIDVDKDFLTPDQIWTLWSYVVATDDKVYPGNPWQEYVAPEGQYPVSRDQIKAMLSITDDTKDADIDMMLPILIAQYSKMRHAPFDRVKNDEGEWSTKYPIEMAPIIAQMWDYNYSVRTDNAYAGGTPSSEKIGSYAVSYGGAPSAVEASFGYPPSIVSQITRYVRFI